MGSLGDSAALWLQRAHWQQMRVDVARRFPLEACGFVAGRQGKSCGVFPVTNVLHSPVRFRMAPQEQLHLFNLFDEREWDLLAIYHSHPNGPPHPSPTDAAEAAYPEVFQIIWSTTPGENRAWDCRVFIIRQQVIRTATLHFFEQQKL